MYSPKLFLTWQLLLPTIVSALLVTSNRGATPTSYLDLGTQLEWSTTAGNTYQLQWAQAAAGPWTDLGTPIAGDDSTHSHFEPVPTDSFQFRIVETVPGVEPLPEIPLNGGFESGTDIIPDNWSTSSSSPPVRTSDDSQTGSFCMRAALVNQGATPSESSLSQRVGSQGGSVLEGASYDLSFWARQISSGPSYVQQYRLQWLDATNAIIGSTGLQNFSATIGSWIEITLPDLVAPAGSVDARITFRFVTGAVANGHGEVLLDNVSAATESNAGTPATINYLPLVGQPASKIRWSSELGVPYQPLISQNLVDWTNLGPSHLGNGAQQEILIPRILPREFYRLSFPGGFGGPDPNSGIVALFDDSTVLDPPTTVETPTALVTYIADRARDRHAREANFSAYDHYLSWYWEERTIAIEIIDTVPMGGEDITFNYTTLTPLGAAEFRAFFRGIGTVAEYYHNQIADLVGPNQYSATLSFNLPDYSDFEIGDRIEIEISQFIEDAANGRNNYYGTAMLYIIGQGIVPWEGVTLPGIGPPLDAYPLPEHAWLGGQTTLPYQYSNEPEHRFKQTAGNLAPASAQPFMLGRRLHHTDFGDGSHSESGNPDFAIHAGKLGPSFIARSCVECHVNNGRALPPEIGAPMLSTVLRVGSDALGTPHSILGSVLQPQASAGNPVEASATIASYTETSGQYADGTAFTLRQPVYAFQGVTPTYFSARLAPPLVGLGLLEAIGEQAIIDLADPDDENGDGISGRYQPVTDPEDGEPRLGRFTAKVSKARLRHQVAGALNTDMGITTPVFPILDGETSAAGAPEIDAADLERMTRYIALLGVGARRDLDDPQALAGEQLFSDAGCIKCHAPQLSTSPYHPLAELREQTIRPYTDLLLHDMGAGLADNMGENGVTGSEWRTPPLWGIGLTAGVSGGEAYLHDGRARTLEEAILWHGGEAETAKEHFRTMPATDRDALIRFLRSL